MLKNSRPVVLMALMVGSAFGSPAQAAIVNGGFETGDFTGWTVEGFTGQNLPIDDTNHTTANFLADKWANTPASTTNAVTDLQSTSFDGNGGRSPPIGPADGNFFAFASNETAAGNGTLTGSSITQLFNVGTATSLTFSVQFLSNEAPNSGWDFGGVALLDSANLVVREFTIDHDPGTKTSAATVHVTSIENGSFADSPGGWLDESFDLTGLANQNLTFLAYAVNTADMLVESRILLDSVLLVGEESSVAVPEPVTLSLFGAGLLGVALMRRRRRSI